jgi:hypothetical protein
MTDVRVVNADEAYRLLVEVVEGNENFVYTPPVQDASFGDTCVYFVGDQPSCGVGHVLAKLGVTEVHPAENSMGFSKFPAREYGLRFTDEARGLLDRFQYFQDDKQPWGSALQKTAELFDR